METVDILDQVKKDILELINKAKKEILELQISGTKKSKMLPYLKIIDHSEDTKEFDGVLFLRESGRKYFQDKYNRRLHRVVWEYYEGPVPEGFHIHHIDGDALNNNINNLSCIASSKHLKVHWVEQYEKKKQIALKSLDKAQEAAKAWHKSEEGRRWHKEQYERVKEQLHAANVENKCLYCYKKYMSVRKGKFCSKNCKTKHRYHTNQDHIVVSCEWCGGDFKKNKYASTKFCSKKCSAANTALLKKAKHIANT